MSVSAGLFLCYVFPVYVMFVQRYVLLTQTTSFSPPDNVTPHQSPNTASTGWLFTRIIIFHFLYFNSGRRFLDLSLIHFSSVYFQWFSYKSPRNSLAISCLIFILSLFIFHKTSLPPCPVI